MVAMAALGSDQDVLELTGEVMMKYGKMMEGARR